MLTFICVVTIAILVSHIRVRPWSGKHQFHPHLSGHIVTCGSVQQESTAVFSPEELNLDVLHLRILKMFARTENQNSF